MGMVQAATVTVLSPIVIFAPRMALNPWLPLISSPYTLLH